MAGPTGLTIRLCKGRLPTPATSVLPLTVAGFQPDGVSYNGPNIFQYAYSNLNSNGTLSPVPLGIKGPGGDIYLDAHTQVDAQASFRMYKGLQFIFAGLNLTNEVFGFYAGSPIYPIQREYYKPTYEFGLRYSRTSEK